VGLSTYSKSVEVGDTFKEEVIITTKGIIGKYMNVKMNDFTSHKIQLQKGDTLYMFSDGFADQFGGPDARKYMSKPFKRFFLSIQDKPMSEQKELLDAEIKQWMRHINPTSGANFTQIDDICVIGVKIL